MSNFFKATTNGHPDLKYRVESTLDNEAVALCFEKRMAYLIERAMNHYMQILIDLADKIKEDSIKADSLSDTWILHTKDLNPDDKRIVWQLLEGE